VADLDLDARRDWLALFPFLDTRRPDTYGALVALSAPFADYAASGLLQRAAESNCRCVWRQIINRYRHHVAVNAKRLGSR